MCTNKKVALNWYYIKLKGKCDILEVRFDLKKNVTEKEKQEFIQRIVCRVKPQHKTSNIAYL